MGSHSGRKAGRATGVAGRRAMGLGGRKAMGLGGRKAMGLGGRKAMGLAAVLIALALMAAACGDDGDEGGQADGGGGGGRRIALLLPESKTTRYETQDRPLFEREVEERCPDCEILYSNADQDAAKQQQQVEAALTNGADVLVLDPVDFASAGALVARAKQSNVPVISYDRLIRDADIDYYISFDNVRVGELQGEALVEEMERRGTPNGTIVMIHGSPTDNNAGQFKQGAKSAIEKSDVVIGAEYDTPEWSDDQAQQEMDQAITRLGKDQIDGVYAANDGLAGGAIAAMKGAGINPLPPVTGQDAQVAGIQRILAGEQFMTVYKAIDPEAEAAARLAVALARDEDVPEGLVNRKVDNGMKRVDSVILDPVAVTKDNVKETVIDDGFWTIQQICTGPYVSACQSAGLT